MIKLKIEFVLRKTGECVVRELTLEEMKPFGSFVYIANPVNDEEEEYFVYAIGGIKVWRPEGNVICAHEVELLSLKTEFEFA